MNTITVTRPGLLSTVQDSGRFKLRHLGIPWSGCLVPVWQKMANALVDNALDNSVIESWEGGLDIAVADKSVRFAFCAHEGVELLLNDGVSTQKLQPAKSYLAPSHSTILLRSTGNYRHAVIAFSGLEVQKQLGSSSTYAKATLGGLNGSVLKTGDVICVNENTSGAEYQCTNPVLKDYEQNEIRVVLGPQQDHFSDEGINNLLNGNYTLSTDADRMGVRLTGPEVQHKNAAAKDIVSDAIVPGSIQVPGTGQPIVLLNDAHTAGGYPKVATVLSIDLPLLGLRRPGTVFSFRAVSIDDAINAVRVQDKTVQKAIGSLSCVTNNTISNETLFKHNLIGGVTDGNPI